MFGAGRIAVGADVADQAAAMASEAGVGVSMATCNLAISSKHSASAVP